jgi:hypothetical protein
MKDNNFEKIKKSVRSSNTLWQKHALQRMYERNISRTEVKQTILDGYVIENYSDDYPFPSVLIACITNSKPLHVVVAFDESSLISYIITAYIPDDKHFEQDLITRIENDDK